MSEEIQPLPRENGKPLYEQVRAWLLQQVTSGRWPVHHMLPPEVTLAANLGVSRVTLRQAMRDLVQHGVFTKISGRGTFVAIQPEAHLPLLKPVRPSGKADLSQLVGVVVPYTNLPFTSTLVAHLEHELYERGYRMLLTNSQESLSLQSQHLRQLVQLGVAGIILYSGAFLHDETVHFVQKKHVPLVLLDRYYPAIPTAVVTSDHWQGAYTMTEHLLSLGHRRIGFVLAKPEIVTSTLARFEGYKAALKEYGVAFHEELVMHAHIRETTVHTYLERAQTTAVFARNDDSAVEFLHILHLLGKRVPEDLSLVGFDDLPLVSRLDPPLTTIRQQTHQLSATTVHLLIELINHPDETPKTITLPTELVMRNSTAPSFPHDPLRTIETLQSSW